MPIYDLYSPKLSEKDCVPKVYAYYFTRWKGFEMKLPHVHPWMEIMYVVQGTCRVLINDQSIAMKNGDFIFINAGLSHRLVQAQEESCRMLNLEFAFEENTTLFPIMSLLRRNSEFMNLINKKPPYFLLKDLDEIQPILMNLVHELSLEERKNTDLIQLYVTQLLLIIARQSKSHDSEKTHGLPYVQKALQYMNQNYDQPIQIEDIAMCVNLHPNYLHRLFKKAIGITLHTYLMNLRLDKAKMLLERTDIPITDISDYVGLGSRQYFSYSFKKAFGMTPLEYRKKS